MRRIIILNREHILPFNEPARDLRVQNVPLWLWQRDLLSPFVSEEREFYSISEAKSLTTAEDVETLAHCDNLYFNRTLIEEFIGRARTKHKPVRLAFRRDDRVIANHSRPLSNSFEESGDVLLVDFWYLPQGLSELDQAKPLIVESEAREVGYYHVPPFMASEIGDLTYLLPRKALVALDNWVHLFVINILFGVFARGKDMEDRANRDWRFRLKILARSIWEQKRVLDNSELVKIGRNCTIDPSAVIHGPTTIGNDVTIGPNVVIDNCTIGNNVNISQGCQLMLSVVSDGCFLPFRAALFMTTLMENTMVAQNTCLQMCVVGRDTFIGAGTTFTDLKVIPSPIRVEVANGHMEPINMPVLGGCVGHHCRLSSGLILYPARTVESDVILLANNDNQFIVHNVRYEESSHHALELEVPYPRLYPRNN